MSIVRKDTGEDWNDYLARLMQEQGLIGEDDARRENSMNRERKHVSGRDKLAILKQYLVDKIPLFDLCDQRGLQPSQIYYWQNQLFEQGAGVFERKPGRQVKQADTIKDHKITQLEAAVAERDAKLAQKNEVIAELMEDNVRSKKSRWGTLTGVWVPHDTRDDIVDYINRWTARNELPAKRLLHWLELSTSKFHQWRKR